jgi:multidrug transporter EmrE-like cation transporter
LILEKILPVFFLILAIVCQAIAAVMSKFAAISLGGVSSIITQIIFNPYYISSLTFLGFQTVFWILTLRSFDLSLVYPAMSANYLLVICFSVIIFHETITITNVIGLLVIFLGITILFSKKKMIIKNYD